MKKLLILAAVLLAGCAAAPKHTPMDYSRPLLGLPADVPPFDHSRPLVRHLTPIEKKMRDPHFRIGTGIRAW